MNEPSARKERSEKTSGRRPHERSERPGRFRAFTFLLARGDEMLEATFYEASPSAATRLASVWAAQRGWTVEGCDS